jgi:hypothetical protein
MSREAEHDEDDGGATGAIDEKLAKAEIAAGARALKNLAKSAGHNWSQGWSIAIRGWRGLRDLAFKRAGVRETKSQAYRDAMGALLDTGQGADYKAIPKDTRAAMSKLIGHIDEIDAWHATLSTWDRERWTNPQTIVKHCPPHLLVGSGHNKRPQPSRAKKPKGSTWDADLFRSILMEVIREFVLPVNPERAAELLKRIEEADLRRREGGGRNDSLEDLEIDGADE